MRALLGLVLFTVACSSSDGTTATDAGTPDVVPDAELDTEPDVNVSDDAGTGSPGTLLWFGPHPDDEYYLAPVLGQLCVDLGWSCTFVIATRGEGGSCKLAAGCQPDLESVRMAEMQASAALFGATLHHWDLGDDGAFEPYPGDVENVVAAWAAKEGSVEALLARVTQEIEEVRPDVIYSMDWRHGCYCHPTHRALGALVARAVRDMGSSAPPLRMLATAVEQTADGVGFQPVVPGDSTLEAFDATTYLESVGGEAWLYLVQVLRTHRSQFDLSDADAAFIANGPPNMKRIYNVPFDGVIEDDPTYEGLCSPSTF